MNSENVFSVWRFVGKSTPFIVRRNGWFHMSYKVTRVIPKGQYGEAYGFKLKDGKLESENSQEELIDCSGCSNWELIEDLNEDTSKVQWNCIDENNNLTFGKYKGSNAFDLQKQDAEYMKWAFANIGGLTDLLFSRKYDVALQSLYDLKKQIKRALSFTSDDWIKSSIDFNFDSVLDDYKWKCALNRKTVDQAVVEIEALYTAVQRH